MMFMKWGRGEKAVGRPLGAFGAGRELTTSVQAASMPRRPVEKAVSDANLIASRGLRAYALPQGASYRVGAGTKELPARILLALASHGRGPGASAPERAQGVVKANIRDIYSVVNSTKANRVAEQSIGQQVSTLTKLFAPSVQRLSVVTTTRQSEGAVRSLLPLWRRS